MPRIEVDINKCVGCRSCELACSYHHRKLFLPEISSIQVHFDYQYNVNVLISDSCDCLEDPPCLAVCPTKAIRLDLDYHNLNKL